MRRRSESPGRRWSGSTRRRDKRESGGASGPCKRRLRLWRPRSRRSGRGFERWRRGRSWRLRKGEREARERKSTLKVEDPESRPTAECLHAAEGWECKQRRLRALREEAAPKEAVLEGELARLCTADGRKELAADDCEREMRER